MSLRAENGIAAAAEVEPKPALPGTAYAVLFAISFCHLLNDMMQALVPAIYPLLKESYALDFGQIGLITLCFQMTASVLQPVVGAVTDKRPSPRSLAASMGFTLIGLLLVSRASSFGMLLLAVSLIGVGSAIFHPESSRIARMASGGRHGFAQSLFQVGGNAGTAIGPLTAAFIILPAGQKAVAWFAAVALLAMLILSRISTWYTTHQVARSKAAGPVRSTGLSRNKTLLSLGVLTALLFSKSFYTASMSSYLQFYLIETFGVSVAMAQLYLFLFLGALAVGTMAGGPLGDRIGRKYVIWFSILGVLPFTALLPYASLMWTGVLVVLIGLILASAFSAIVVFGQELLPGRIGMVSGLFFGLSFGIGGVGAAVLGEVADWTSIGTVFKICSFLPAIGILTIFLPNMRKA
ncbi:MAG: transporter [Hyphomicrobiales bacterium]|nr:transporter [Hyphomicrobiales bacterium]